MISLSELSLRETIFTWEAPDKSEQLSFAIDRLNKAAAEQESPDLVQLVIDPEFAKALPTMRGLELHRLVRLGNDPSKWAPILVCLMGDNTGNIVDGNHRMYIAYKLGRETILACLLPEVFWREFVVDIPRDWNFDSHLKDWSGIP